MEGGLAYGGCPIRSYAKMPLAEGLRGLPAALSCLKSQSAHRLRSTIRTAGIAATTSCHRGSGGRSAGSRRWTGSRRLAGPLLATLRRFFCWFSGCLLFGRLARGLTFCGFLCLLFRFCHVPFSFRFASLKSFHRGPPIVPSTSSSTKLHLRVRFSTGFACPSPKEKGPEKAGKKQPGRFSSGLTGSLFPTTRFCKGISPQPQSPHPSSPVRTTTRSQSSWRFAPCARESWSRRRSGRATG